MNRILSFCLLSVLLAFTSRDVCAGSVGFTRITANNSVDIASQLVLDVTDPGSAQMLFTFTNLGPAASSIGRVYFDDGASPFLASIAAVINALPGVDFGTSYPGPQDLPAGNTIGFVADLSLGADVPPPKDGVQPGEQLGVRFNLTGGTSYADALTGLLAGELRVGIHVISIAPDGDSDAFVTGGFEVPEPSALLLLFTGLAGLAAYRRPEAS